MRFTAQRRADARVSGPVVRKLAVTASAILLTGLGVTLAASPASASAANCSAEGCVHADLNATVAPQVNKGQQAHPDGNSYDMG